MCTVLLLIRQLAHGCFMPLGTPGGCQVKNFNLSAIFTANAGVFRAAKCIPDGVACFSSKNPISGRQWPSAIKDNHVLVMTVQALLNMLEDGDATLQAFDLMVRQLAITSLYLYGLS